MVLVLVDGLFEEGPQIGSVVRVHQRLHKDGFAGLWGLRASLPKDYLQRFLCGLFVDIGQVACHTAQSIYARGAGFASQQGPNLRLVLELRSRKSDQVPTCDVKVWQLWMSRIRGGSLFLLILAQMLLNPVALLCPCLCMKRSDLRMWGAMCG